ncbi:molybdopterin molybdotransferase MoeA [Kocuria sp.]|uniref:molybdopterin molybdotransferase MoeA n=1 Tax=Kocuria sp. TaxID=1871328 RepID=UPI0026DF3CF0|nr:molybdopterin molybdotransferase MoeA [Kocuria sp.]MDO5617831.1 molybdopterin molybdotransferase MoeA [Kocuria sp.]
MTEPTDARNQDLPPTVSHATWETARTTAHAAAAPLPEQWLPLSETIGETLAQDVTAQVPLPHYSSSAMDGWAVNGPGPWTVLVPEPEEDDPRLTWARTGNEPVERVTSVGPDQATAIVTGGLVPEGATAVLRSEWGTEFDGQLVLNDDAAPGAPQPGQHIRPAGEEASVGDVLLSAGVRLNPAHVAFAAVTGQDMLPVRRRPRVTLLLTGDEVDEAGLPEPGRVRDAFGPQLPQFVHLLGGQVDAVHRLGDDLEVLTERLTVAETGADSVLDSRAQLIITTGGTGGSSVDHLRTALADSGAHLIVDELALRPGHPAVLARMPDDGPFVLGLPGNPLAAMTALMLLGAPLLAAFGGAGLPPTVEVSLTRPVDAFKSVRLLPGLAATSAATLDSNAYPWARSSRPSAAPLAHAGANMMRGFSQANVLLVIPQEGVSEGGTAVAVPLPWL